MRSLKKTYGYFLTLPDRLYPFACQVGGRRVRGRRSYEQTAARAFKKYGSVWLTWVTPMALYFLLFN